MNEFNTTYTQSNDRAAVTPVPIRAFDRCGVIHIQYAGILSKATGYIRANLSNDITLDDVARAVYLSPSHFGKLFRAETGYRFREYLTLLRIEKSCELLCDPQLRIADVSSAAGFRDQSYFTKVFKRHVGVIPSRYAETLKEKASPPPSVAPDEK